MEFFIYILIAVAFLIGIWLSFRLGRAVGRWQKEAEISKSMASIKRDIADRQRAGIKGRVAEMFAPFLKNFPYAPSDCKFIGEPIDYIVFNGMSDGRVRDIVFLEVKSGKSRMSEIQKNIKSVIEKKGVRWEEFRFEE